MTIEYIHTKISSDHTHTHMHTHNNKTIHIPQLVYYSYLIPLLIKPNKHIQNSHQHLTFSPDYMQRRHHNKASNIPSMGSTSMAFSHQHPHQVQLEACIAQKTNCLNNQKHFQRNTFPLTLLSPIHTPF